MGVGRAGGPRRRLQGSQMSKALDTVLTTPAVLCLSPPCKKGSSSPPSAIINVSGGGVGKETTAKGSWPAEILRLQPRNITLPAFASRQGADSLELARLSGSGLFRLHKQGKGFIGF